MGPACADIAGVRVVPRLLNRLPGKDRSFLLCWRWVSCWGSGWGCLWVLFHGQIHSEPFLETRLTQSSRKTLRTVQQHNKGASRSESKLMRDGRRPDAGTHYQ